MAIVGIGPFRHVPAVPLSHNPSLQVLSSQQRLWAETGQPGAGRNARVIWRGEPERPAAEGGNRNPLAKLA
jgi:hypothetical protein